MSFYSAFPSSPLSRSALAREPNADRKNAARGESNSSKPYGRVAAFKSPDPRRPSPNLTGSQVDIERIEGTQTSPLGTHASSFSAAPSSRHVSGPARLMQSPFGPAWSPTANTPFDGGYAISPALPHASFARSAKARRRSSAYSNPGASPTPNFGSLVGSFQESLLRGRMSMPASKPLIFDAEIGVLGMGRCRPSLRCPPHVHVKFPAHFYDFHAMDSPAYAPGSGSTAALGSPYVGTIDLESHYQNMLFTRRLSDLSTSPRSSSRTCSSDTSEIADLPAFPGYAVPPRGQVQLIVKYPELNAVKLFLVPYDLTDMEPGTKTFVRQKTVVRSAPSSVATTGSEHGDVNNRSPAKEALRFAIHLQFCCPPTKPRPDDRQAGFDGANPRRFRHHQESDRKRSAKQARSPNIYLHKSIRLVFAARALDSSEKLVDHIETPGEGVQRFSSYNGPEEEWLQLQHEIKSSEPQFKPTSFTDVASPRQVTDLLPTGRDGLGIAIQAPAAYTSRSSPGNSDIDEDVPPNSDPNGERWQGGSSFSHNSTGLRSDAIPSTSMWSLSSQESSFEQSVGGWSSGGQVSSATYQPAPSQALASIQSTRESDAESRSASASLALIPTRSHSPLQAAMHPARIRSASTAGQSEARVQSVSALGRLEESRRSAWQPERPPSDTAMPLRPQRKAGNDRPSLLSKLSEQFSSSRTSSPTPTGSPKLGPVRRQADPAAQDDLAADDHVLDAVEDSQPAARTMR